MQTSDPAKLKPSALAEAIGVSLPYASQILSNARPPKVPLAIRIYRATGHKLGPIAGATEDEITALEASVASIERFQGTA
jgi:transcriptional regulator with XRE-family HTH domain